MDIYNNFLRTSGTSSFLHYFLIKKLSMFFVFISKDQISFTIMHNSDFLKNFQNFPKKMQVLYNSFLCNSLEVISD